MRKKQLEWFELTWMSCWKESVFAGSLRHNQYLLVRLSLPPVIYKCNERLWELIVLYWWDITRILRLFSFSIVHINTLRTILKDQSNVYAKKAYALITKKHFPTVTGKSFLGGGGVGGWWNDMTISSQTVVTWLTDKQKQECIPVGCIPPAAVAVGGGGEGLDQIPLNFPLGFGPGDPPREQTPRPGTPPEQTPSPVDRITDACENITLLQLRCGR